MIYLEPNETFHFSRTNYTDCLWVIVATPGFTVQATVIVDPESAMSTFSEVNPDWYPVVTFYSAAAPHGLDSRPFALESAVLGPEDYPQTERFVSNMSIMWVTQTNAFLLIPLLIDFEQLDSVGRYAFHPPCFSLFCHIIRAIKVKYFQLLGLLFKSHSYI